MNCTTPLRRHAGLLLLLALVGSVLLGSPSSASAAASPRQYHGGYCVGTEGVTVVVDFAPSAVGFDPSAPTMVRCMLGTPANGRDALERAGFSVEFVSSGFGPMECRIDHFPTAGAPTCGNPGYWSFWVRNSSGEWDFATTGAADYEPKPGDIEGWRFVEDWQTDPGYKPRAVATGPSVSVEAPASTPAGSSVQLELTVPDTASTLACSIDAAAFAACPEAAVSTTRRALAVPGLTAGTHTLRVNVTDSTNSVTRIERTFVVASPAPPAPIPASLADQSVASIAPGSAVVTGSARAGDVAQSVYAEYTDEADLTGAARSAAVAVPAGAAAVPVRLRLVGLAPATGYSWRLVTTGGGGTIATPWSTFTTTRRAARLRLQLDSTVLVRGRRVAVDASGLADGEAYQVRIGSRVIATGAASDDGGVDRLVTVPTGVTLGRTTLTVQGSQADRLRDVTVYVVGGERLRIERPARAIAGSRPLVTISGLEPSEPVRVLVDGRVVSPDDAHANADGEYELRIAAGRVGVRDVDAFGIVATRTVSARITVIAPVRRER